MMQGSSSQPDRKDASVGRLYQRHWLGLFTAIRHSISSQEDAEDILLDVFLAALESRTLLSMSEQYQEVWLRRVAYNKCMDFHRRAVRHQEELAQLQKHLASLSTIQQEILRLRFADELPCARIAARLDKSEGAVRTMLSRTLNLLRGMYTKQREESYHD